MNQTYERKDSSPKAQLRRITFESQPSQSKLGTDLEHIAKIYNIPKKKSSKVRNLVGRSRGGGREEVFGVVRNLSGVNEKSPPKSCKAGRFLKVQSQINHMPIGDLSYPLNYSRSYRKSSKKCTQHFDESPIY